MPIRFTTIGLLLAAAVLWACTVDFELTKGPPNFLVLIADDLGQETLSCYGVGEYPAHTPNLDRLCADGMRFDNFWVQPAGSPTRASILTGRYSFRNGIGALPASPLVDFVTPPMLADAGQELPRGVGGGKGVYKNPFYVRGGLARDAYGLPRALSRDGGPGYTTAAVGKWQLADELNGGLDHPSILGFDHYAGNMRAASLESYFAWSEVVNGRMTGGRTGYATSATVDDAIAWYDYAATDRPWLLWVAFNAPHEPWGAPPASLLDPETVASLDAEDPRTYHRAMIEAMDTEIGRLLDALDPRDLDNTYVIFLGDNGSASRVVSPPFEAGRSKGTVYQGGINVPLIIAGPDVSSASVSKALANSVDLFATILELADAGNDPSLETVIVDSTSLAPVLGDPAVAVREFAYAELFGQLTGEIADKRAIRNDRYKLVMDLHSDTEEFYDLSLDPFERNDLLKESLSVEAQRNYDELVLEMLGLLATG